MANQWMWAVIHKSDNGQWLTSVPFNNNAAAWAEAQRLASTFPGIDFFVAETTHVATRPKVEFHPVVREASNVAR